MNYSDTIKDVPTKENEYSCFNSNDYITSHQADYSVSEEPCCMTTIMSTGMLSRRGSCLLLKPTNLYLIMGSITRGQTGSAQR